MVEEGEKMPLNKKDAAYIKALIGASAIGYGAKWLLELHKLSPLSLESLEIWWLPGVFILAGLGLVYVSLKYLNG
ncbi:MAG: hypothetical protein KAW41_05020 [Candidatus Diapherotrites archaeon]|nr:hypothetical protein [Candidatus Diapherotrites archaeon]